MGCGERAEQSRRVSEHDWQKDAHSVAVAWGCWVPGRGRREMNGSMGYEGEGRGVRGEKSSLSVLLLFVAAFGAVVCVAVGIVAEVHFVHGLERLGEIVLQGGDGSAHRRAPETVRDEVEVGQAALDARLQNGVGP